METEYIKDIFLNYIKTDKTQHAILLNGGWGCGKTYFWKYTLKKIAEENNFKTIYISLNGISKIEDIKELLFIQLLNIKKDNDNSKFSSILELSGSIANSLSKTFLQFDLSSISKGECISLFDLSKRIFCFDDLERCRIPTDEFLGFINNLVEHRNLKAVVLANEGEIQTEEKYTRIKEKVIGRDLKFEIEIRSILPLLFEKYDAGNDFGKFLRDKQEFIKEILEECNETNLRTITFFLEILERIFPILKNTKEEYIQEVIFFCIIITIEYKKGRLTSEDYNNFKDIDKPLEGHTLKYLLKGANEEAKEEDTYSEVFYKTYLQERIKNYFFYPSIYSYILSGYFNSSKLLSDLERRNSLSESISEEDKTIGRLLDYKELSNSEFEELTENLYQYCKEGKYSIYRYVMIADLLFFFSENDLIDKSKEEIQKIIIEGLDISKVQEQSSITELKYAISLKNSSPEIETIKEKLKSIHYEIQRNNYKKDGKAFISHLKNDDKHEVKELLEKHLRNEEFFQCIDVEILFETLLEISNRQLLSLDELLKVRYEVNTGRTLTKEADFLSKLNSKLSAHLKKNKEIKQPQKYLLETLAETLKRSIEHLEETK